MCQLRISHHALRQTSRRASDRRRRCQRWLAACNDNPTQIGYDFVEAQQTKCSAHPLEPASCEYLITFCDNQFVARLTDDAVVNDGWPRATPTQLKLVTISGRLSTPSVKCTPPPSSVTRVLASARAGSLVYLYKIFCLTPKVSVRES